MMNERIAKIFLIAFLFSAEFNAQDLIKYVDPFIGTGGHAHTYPGVTLPFGMVQLSPDTRVGNWDACSGYHYSDSTILGFSHLHLSGTGAQGYGDILFMPTTGKIQLEPGDEKNTCSGYRSKFNHSSEYAEPGYYSVLLLDDSIKAELTTTTRAGFHRYTYPKKSSANLIINLVHMIQSVAVVKEAEFKIIGENKIEGMKRTSGYIKDHVIYFVAEFSKPISEYRILNDCKIIPDMKEVKGDSIKAYLKFNLGGDDKLLIKIGISTVDYDGARKNLAAEIPGWDFEKIRADAKEAWNKQLSKIIVNDSSEEKKKIFYTALYHASIVPNIYYDVDRRYRGRDREIHECKNFDNYTALSIWDTFRSTHPLYVLIDPDRAGNFVKNLLAKYEENGMLPKIEYGNNDTKDMIGYHSLSVIADAFAKGIGKFNTKLTLKAMVNSAYNSDPEMKLYMQYGYIPSDKKRESVSKTLEYSYDDWTIYKMAKAVGDEKIADEFFQRANYYSNLFDGSNRFFRGKNSFGYWVPEFDKYEISRDFTESNAWQYSLFALHDINGLINLYGGKAKFIKHVDGLFSAKSIFTGKKIEDLTGVIGQYAHGNEPSHHIAYIYNFVDQPWKTQSLVHKICKKMYTTKPDGLIGNEDCGQMSSWFIFSSMGFYPFCPGTDEYQIGIPFYEKVSINLEGGKTFIVKSENLSDKNCFIQSARLNGKELTVPFIKHSDLINGGELIFKMGSAPNKNWGKLKEAKPYSLSSGKKVSLPYVKNDVGFYEYKAKIEMGCLTDGAKIYYTLNGSEPDSNSTLYKKPLTLEKTATIKMRAYKKDYESSKTVTLNAVKAEFEKAADVSKDSLENGVKYKYYEGNFNSVYDIQKVEMKKSGTLEYISIEPANVPDMFGFVYEGYLYVPEDAIYSFFTKSDDGSVLLIDDKEVVNNDGSHKAARAVSYVVALGKGYHPITLLYYDRYLDNTIELWWGSKNIPTQIVPGKNLFRRK